jgi:hypothetical protein
VARVVELTEEELDAHEDVAAFIRSAIRDLVYARQQVGRERTPPRGSRVRGVAEALRADPLIFDGVDMNDSGAVSAAIDAYNRRSEPEMIGDGESLEPKKG